MADSDAVADTDRPRKRKRKIWSCSECRRRKLQCDRDQPACQRCIKSGQAALCSYMERVGGASSDHLSNRNESHDDATAPPESCDLQARVEVQQQRIHDLEAALLQSNAQLTAGRQQLPLTPMSSEQHNQSAKEIIAPQSSVLAGGSFHTRFNGSTHPGSIIAQIDGLSQFTKTSFRNFVDLEQTRRDARQSKFRRGQGFAKPCAIAELLALFPDRQKADEMIDKYFLNLDCLYHVVHKGTFETQYHAMWLSTNETNPAFAVLALLMIAAGYCVASLYPGLHTDEGFQLREIATRTILSCQYWIDNHLQEFIHILDYQIAFMLVFVKQLDARGFKRTWTHAGAVVRNFMCAGLHKDPDRLKGTTSATDKEMRVRLWAAAAEFELQASFEKGMPATDWSSQSDIPKPSNVNDEELLSRPTPQTRQMFTSSTFLAVSSESISLRHRLNKLLNDTDQQLTFTQAKDYTDQLQMHLRAVPKWQDAQGGRSTALLSLNLLQYKLALHEQQLRQEGSAAERQFSHMVMMDAATSMLDIHERLTSEGSLALELLCSDHVRAALSICLVATSMTEQTDSLLASLIVRESPRYMDRAITMIKEKALRFGDDQRQLWIPITAESFMKAQGNPSEREHYMQEAVERFLVPMHPRQDMTAPKNPLSVENPGASLMAWQSSSLSTHFFSLDDIAAWTFEDWDPLTCLD